MEVKKEGFSLIEMSVVLIIIAFIVAGVMAAKSLQSESRIRAIVMDFSTHKTAYQNFLDYYGQKPGDYTRANAAFNLTNANGNGNGFIDFNSTAEMRKVWLHLRYSEFGIFEPVALTSNTDDRIIVSQTVPKGPFENSGYLIASRNSTNNNLWTNAASPWGATNVTAIYAGSTQTYNTADPDSGFSFGALTPLEAFSIDKKMDDAFDNATTVSFTGATTGIIRSFTGYRQGTVLLGGAGRDCTSGNNYLVNDTTNRPFSTCVIGMSVEKNNIK
jgi:prepilin-type N-terminal cleavage/methylation domain-containing protein